MTDIFMLLKRSVPRITLVLFFLLKLSLHHVYDVPGKSLLASLSDLYFVIIFIGMDHMSKFDALGNVARTLSKISDAVQKNHYASKQVLLYCIALLIEN